MQVKTEEKSKKGVIYARQSYGSEENSLSIEQQIERCKRWCFLNGVDVVGIFTDHNTSSELYPESEKGKAYCATDIGWQRWRKTRIFANRNQFRKGLAKAFSAIESQHVDYFIVDENTRFYRNPSATSQLDIFCIVTLQEAKTALVNVTENKIDYLENNINIAMWRAFAQYEMEKVNEKAAVSKANRKKNTESGIVYSNAYGVIWKDKQISFDVEKAKVIEFIFNSVIQGKTYGSILHTLNSEYISLSDGKSFYESNIYHIIQNSVYSGYRRLNDGRYVEIKNISSSPIIPFSVYLEANRIMKDKKNNSGKQKCHYRGKETTNFLPFSGLLKCGNCGSRLLMKQDNGITYFCYSTHATKDKNCTPSRIRTNFDIDNDDFLLVFQPLFLLYLTPYIEELRNIQNNNEAINALTAEIENTKSKINTIMETFLASSISKEVFQSSIDKANQELVEKENKLTALKVKSYIYDDEEIPRINSLIGQIKQDAERVVIEHDTYSRLLRDTVKEIIVYLDEIKVVLKDGNAFNLPRIKRGRTKCLPYANGTQYVKDGKQFVVITYSIGNTNEKQTLLETENYKIEIIM